MQNWMEQSILSNSVMGDKLKNVELLATAIRESNLAGLIAEAGVYKGGSAKLLATVFPDRRILLFDSFEGMLEADEHPEGRHKKGDFGDVSLQAVQEFLKNYRNCEFYKGWFPATADFLSDEEFAFVHLDLDYQQSTRDGIRVFWPKMAKGGIMLFDDWTPLGYRGQVNTPGVNVAFDEYFSQIEDYQILLTDCPYMRSIIKI